MHTGHWGSPAMQCTGSGGCPLQHTGTGLCGVCCRCCATALDNTPTRPLLMLPCEAPTLPLLVCGATPACYWASVRGLR
jgi:hypothetical protein